jgi:hypothetical protein
MVPWNTVTSDGAILIMLHMEHNSTAGCDKECIDTMGTHSQKYSIYRLLHGRLITALTFQNLFQASPPSSA